MTTISCDVKKCAYNTDGGCKLHKIEVGTKNAKMSDETRCESFAEGEKSVSSSCSCRSDACIVSEIKCSAQNCRYNADGECEARSVDICNCKTCNCGETECRTFTIE